MRMRDYFVWMTGVFWIGIGYYAVRCPTGVAPAEQGPTQSSAVPDAGQKKIAPRIAAKLNLAPVTLTELARHATPDDCWIAIAGTVYDLTGYVDLHPSKQQEMDGYCGKEGTRAWDLKDSGKERGQPHTKRAAEFLGEYPQVGVLQK